MLEVLQGARDDAHAGRLKGFLDQFVLVGMFNQVVAEEAARNFRELRSRGIAVRKTVDLIIGTFCILHGHRLLHDDRDFEPMREHLGLLVM
jgi:predicted nucleic acid-binding protein